MQRSLANFQSGIAGFGMKVAGLAATFIGVQQSIAAFRNGLDMAGRLNDLSKTTGETAGNLAMLERAFQNNGMAAEQVGVSIAKMSEFIVNLQSGSESAAKAANAMSISMADLANKSPVERMEVLMRAIAGIADPALRTATAVDVFGRSGRAVIPLASQFSNEMANARDELGSLVPILNESGASLDELGDKLQNSVGNKFNELAVGFAAGITGANDFVTALSRIDAAGFGKGIGDSLRIAFDAPLSTAKAIGYTLLTGVKEAGNGLINGFNTAGKFLINLLSDGQYWQAVGDRIKSALMEAVNGFNKLLLMGVEEGLLKPLSNLPGIVGEPFRAALQQVQEIRKGLEATSAKNYEDWTKSGENLWKAVERATQSTEVIEKDWLGAQQSAEDAARHMMDAQEQSRQIREDSAETAANYGEGSAAIRNALNDIRGFDLKGQMGPDARPDWTKSNKPPPSNSSQRIAAEEANARALHSARGGGRAAGPMTEGMKTAALRGEARANDIRQRGNELADAGMFRSAVRAMDRADRTADRIMDNQRVRDFYRDEFGAGNAGEAFRDFRNTFGMDTNDIIKKALEDLGLKYDPQRDLQSNFDRLAREQSKTPEERKREDEEARAKGAAPGGGRADSQPDSLSAILTHVASIDEKLPLNAMSNQ